MKNEQALESLLQEARAADMPVNVSWTSGRTGKVSFTEAERDAADIIESQFIFSFSVPECRDLEDYLNRTLDEQDNYLN